MLHAGKFNWTYVLGTGLMDPLYRGHTAIVHEGATDAAAWPRLHRPARRDDLHRGADDLPADPAEDDVRARDVPTLRHCMSAGEQLSGRGAGARGGSASASTSTRRSA